MISQYDKDMCCLYIAEGMSYIWQQKGNQELSRILESLADRKLMKRVHGGYAITLKGLLAVKVWRLHLFLFHHDEHKYFRRKKSASWLPAGSSGTVVSISSFITHHW